MDIQDAFNKFKEQENRKPKCKGEIAPILKRILKDPGTKLAFKGTFNQFLER